MSRVVSNGIFLIFIQAVTPFSASPMSFADDHGKEAKRSIGDTFFIPCDISTPVLDRAVLILLLKDQSKIPIASIDFRHRDRVTWSSETYKGRLHLSMDSKPGGLLMKGVTSNDEGMYTCRVDFRSSPTRVMERKLVVTRPVDKIVLTIGEEERRVDSLKAGPFEVGTKLSLTCTAKGGYPSPNVTWWIKETLIDGLMESRTRTNSRNTLHLSPLTRNDHDKELTCRASNSLQHLPLTLLVILEVKAPQTRVRIRVNKPFVLPTRGPGVVTVAERAQLRLKCEVTSANPPPRIIWTRKLKGSNQTIGKSSLHSFPSREQTTSSQRFLSASFYFVPHLSDHEAVITCRTPLFTPNVPQTPLSAKGPNHPKITYTKMPENYENTRMYKTTENSKFNETSQISERRKSKFLTSSEATPNAENKLPLNDDSLQLFETPSTLDVLPRPTILKNSTFQVALKDSPTLETEKTPIEDHAQGSIKLNVLYAPRVRVSVRNSDERVMEGDDVYLHCHADANPPPSNLYWRRKGQELLQSSSEFIFDDSRTSLLLPSVTSEVSGQYSCVATNSEGESSNEFTLHVWHKPHCRSEDQTLIAGLLNEIVELSCDVSSFPNPTSFKWHYKFTQNSTVNYYNILPLHSSSGTLRYRLQSKQDFTTIVCTATNSLGQMEQPCDIRIVPAGPPEPVTHCALHTKRQSIRLVCNPGFHGGSPQMFTLKVWNNFNQGNKKTLMNQRNSSSPSFEIPNFTSSHSITLEVIPWNCDGQGLPVNLNYSTLETIKLEWTTIMSSSSNHTTEFPFKRNDQGNFWSHTSSGVDSSPALILGVVVLSLSCSVLVLCCVRLRIRKKRRCPTEVHAGLYHEKAFSSSTQETLEQRSGNERGYLSAGCLLIGVSSEGSSKGEPLEKWRLLNERKFGDDPEFSEENMLNGELREEDNAFTRAKIEKYAHSPQRRESARRVKSLEQVSTSSDESLSFRPESKASMVTVVFSPSK